MILQVGWSITKIGNSNRVPRIFQELLINKSTFKTIYETYCESFPSKCLRLQMFWRPLSLGNERQNVRQY